VRWLLSTSADHPLADAALCEPHAPFTCNFEILLLTLEEMLLLVDQPLPDITILLINPEDEGCSC
jgi:hypothetical protein